jgi:hypothetical protein
MQLSRHMQGDAASGDPRSGVNTAALFVLISRLDIRRLYAEAVSSVVLAGGSEVMLSGLT